MSSDRPSSGSLLPLAGALVVAVLLLGGAVLLNLGGEDRPEPAAGFALDAADPWPLRGDAALVAPAALAGLRADWVAARPLVVRQRAGTVELVLLQPGRWAVATRRGGTWELQERRLPRGPVGVLAAVLPDGPGRRLLAVADPDVDALSVVQGRGLAYGTELTPLADGVGELALTDRDREGDVVGVDDEQVVVQAPLPA